MTGTHPPCPFEWVVDHPTETLAQGCTIATAECSASHGWLTTARVPSGMAWSVPAGPVALMVFYGEGRLSSAIAGKDLFEDDLLSWEVDAGTTLYATGEEGILAYVWGWPEDSGLPGLADANPFQVRWGDVQPFETGEDAPRARSLLVVEGVDGDDGSVSKTWKVAAGDILHPDAIGVPAVCRSEGRLTLVGLWENTRHGSGSRLRFGPVTIGSGQRG